MAASTKSGIRTYGDFYENKSILVSYSFDVVLNFDDYDYWGVDSSEGRLDNVFDYPLKSLPNIKPYHILSIDIPLNTFNRETISVGPIQYSYPVLAKEQQLDIKMTFEEDAVGTISKFIQELQQTVVRGGYHVAPALSRLGNIHIYVRDQQGIVVSEYIAKDVFFLGASAISKSYDNAESVKYDITFGTDVIQHDEKYEVPAWISTKRTSFGRESFQ